MQTVHLRTPSVAKFFCIALTCTVVGLFVLFSGNNGSSGIPLQTRTLVLEEKNPQGKELEAALIKIGELEVNEDGGKKLIETLQNEVRQLRIELDHLQSGNKAAAVFKQQPEALSTIKGKVMTGVEMEEHKEQITQQSGETATGGDTCQAKKLFYSNKGDIQMLHAYEVIPFDNPNGGAWTQGFEVTYDQEKIKEEPELQVFVVPHSHDDPGWWYSFEGYYDMYVKSILSLANKYLNDPGMDSMRFIYAEMSFLELWWRQHSQQEREQMKRAIQKGKLEVVTGAWVMTDEANSHLYSLVTEFVEGHEFLRNHIGFKPVNHWSIDPFGLSPTIAYLLKQSNITNMAINRIHYSVKKFLAKSRDLEFHWRQLWAGERDGTDVFTSVFPFGGYDVSKSCGPDPKICCQYDFRTIGSDRWAEFGVSAVHIDARNIEAKATQLVDQYRKKAQLFKTNVVLVPHGEDFRFNLNTEWEDNFKNFQKLFAYINNRTDWKVKAQFGTLQDYFQASHARQKDDLIKTLSGDFFTYADRDDHYWSGYYTSRPFYKHMDRTVQHYLRAADTLYSAWLWKTTRDKSAFAGNELYDGLVRARRHLSVFQHHDGVTGTAKNSVVVDYAKKMLEAIQNCQSVIAATTNALVLGKSVLPTDKAVFVDEEFTHDRLPVKKTIEKGIVSLFNPLPYDRTEVECLHVSQKMKVRSSDDSKQPVVQEIYPVIGDDEHSIFIEKNKFELCFLAFLPATGFSTYSLVSAGPDGVQEAKVFVESGIESSGFPAQQLVPDQIELANEKVSVSIEARTRSVRTVKLASAEKATAVDLHFIKYGVRAPLANWTSREANSVSGAYLFLPDGPAKEVAFRNQNSILVKGKLKQELVSRATNGTTIIHKISLHADDEFVRIKNVVDIRAQNNFELGMRMKSDVAGDDFFSDLNAYQMIRRRRFRTKLPIQAHFYPMPSAAFIEDATHRISLLGRQALGVASLEPGMLEVILDRRLVQDDNRGLDQDVRDNLLTASHFHLHVETFTASRKAVPDSTIEYHSLAAHHSSLRLHSPVVAVVSVQDAPSTKFSLLKSPFPCDVNPISLRTVSAPTNYDTSNPNTKPMPSALLVLQRLGVECALNSTPSGTACPQSTEPTFRLEDKSALDAEAVKAVSLTMLYEEAGAGSLSLEPMEIKSLRVDF